MNGVTAVHQALIYSGRDDYSEVVAAFIREGLEAGERTMLMAPPARLSWVREAMGPDAGEVVFVDSTGAYGIQSHATRAMLQYLGQDRRPSRVVAEQDLAGRWPFEIRDYTRMEAAANVVYRSFPARILCPYDATALDDEVLAWCRQTHPELIDARGCRESPEFRDPRSFVASSTSVVQPPPSAASMGFATLAEVSAARRFVGERLRRARMDPPTAGDITVAAVEILTNALLHGRAPRSVHLYEEAGMLVVHVRDSGTGLADPLAGFFPPSSDITHGRGLWMARQLCNTVEVASDHTGTHVRLLARLP